MQFLPSLGSQILNRGIEMLRGLVLCALGIGMLFLCGLAFVAWWGLCFGSIVLGIVLLLFAPHVLFLPLPLGIFGIAIFSAGLEAMQGVQQNPTEVIKKDLKLEADLAYRQRMMEINKERKLQGLEEIQIATSRELTPAAKEALRKL